MAPEAKKSAALLYVGDWDTNDVYAYDYSSRRAVGTLTGFDEPYGMCVDAKGDIWVTNFASGTVEEYAHGGTRVLQTLTTDGYAIGCSVAPNGDLAVADFYAPGGPGQICRWRHATGHAICYTDASACYYLWPPGYDDKNNLFVIGVNQRVSICELPAGKRQMRGVTFSGVHLESAGAFMWDGKYMALSAEFGSGTGKFTSGIVQFSDSHGNLKEAGTTALSDDCYGDYVDSVQPFIVGKKNTPANRIQGDALAGGNFWCTEKGYGRVDAWKYPQGGDPVRQIPNPPEEPYGQAVSIAR